MPKRKPKQATYKAISSALSKGELGWLNQQDPFGFKAKQQKKKTMDLPRLQKWIENRKKNHEAPPVEKNRRISNRKRKLERDRQQRQEELEEERRRQREELDGEDPEAEEEESTNPQQNQIMIIDLMKHGYEKLIVGDQPKKSKKRQQQQEDSSNTAATNSIGFTLTEPVVIRAKEISAKAKEIIEEQGGICIEVKQ